MMLLHTHAAGTSDRVEEEGCHTHLQQPQQTQCAQQTQPQQQMKQQMCTQQAQPPVTGAACACKSTVDLSTLKALNLSMSSSIAVQVSQHAKI
jgi:hypothetical protein